MIDQVLKDKKVVIFLGAGGVGKTTTSTVFALKAAVAGRKVALLSIDPAKRLADALGIKLGHELGKVELPEGATGSLSAAMLDQKSMFDSMVKRHAKSPKIVSRIFANPIYQAASTNLSGPLEYMALARLSDLVVNPEFDLVVLDTPPDSHALDFLARPNVLAGFMDNKVMTWLVKPFSLANKLGMGRLLTAGEKLMGGVAKVTGVSALRSFADFLVLMQEVIEGFHKSGETVLKIVKANTTIFGLVTVPTMAATRAANSLDAQLRGMGCKPGLLVFNRSLPGGSYDPGDEEADSLTMRYLVERTRGEARARESLNSLNDKNTHAMIIEDQVKSFHSVEELCSLEIKPIQTP